MTWAVTETWAAGTLILFLSISLLGYFFRPVSPVTVHFKLRMVHAERNVILKCSKWDSDKYSVQNILLFVIVFKMPPLLIYPEYWRRQCL